MTTQRVGEILNRSFILTFFAHFALLSIFYIFIPTLPIYLSKLGSNEVEIGILIGIFTLSSVVLRPFVRKSPFKNSRKKVYDYWGPPVCPHFHRLSYSSSFLAPFDRKIRSRNWIRILPYCLNDIDRQYQPRDPQGTKPQLLYSGFHYLRSLSSSLWNISYQPLEFHPSFLGLLRSITMLTIHYDSIEKETSRSIEGFLHREPLLPQSGSPCTIFH